VFDNKIKTNNTNNQFMKFIFLKKISFFKFWFFFKHTTYYY
jgi:hypothetical protein